MADIAFPDHCKTFKVPSSSTSYSYVYIPAASSNPTILFLHGFPSSSYDWRHQISHFSGRGYGVLVPDLLGYGGTDKPADPASYVGKKMATEVVDILEHEKLDKVHAVGHDFGSHLLSRVVNYFPSRLHSCTFVAVPYIAPGQPFDLDMLKQMTEHALGFEKFGYMRFMNSDDSPPIIEAHNASLTSVLYTTDYDATSKNFFPPGALEKWLTADKRTAESSSIMSASETAMHNQIFASGGYRGPTNWYRVLVRHLNASDETSSLASGAIGPEIKCPVLAIDSASSPASLPGFMEASIRPFAPHLRLKTASKEGHWLQIECADEINALLEEFFGEVPV